MKEEKRRGSRTRTKGTNRRAPNKFEEQLVPAIKRRQGERKAVHRVIDEAHSRRLELHGTRMELKVTDLGLGRYSVLET